MGIEEFLFSLGSAISNYAIVLSLLSPIIGGETVILLLSFFAGQGYFSPWIVFFFGLIAMIGADSLWFSLAHSKFANKLKERGNIGRRYKQIEAGIERITRKKDVLIIFIAKLLIGTRILLMLYMGGRKISLMKFVLYDAIPSIVWMGVLVFVGLTASKGYYFIIGYFKNIQLALSIIILIGLCIFLIFKYITNKVIKTR